MPILYHILLPQNFHLLCISGLDKIGFNYKKFSPVPIFKFIDPNHVRAILNELINNSKQMQQEYINQLTTEYSTGEREMIIKKKKVDVWADTLEEAELI